MQPGAMVPSAGTDLAFGPFGHTRYLIKRPFFSFLGRKFHVYSPDGSLCMFVKHPVLKLKQEFTIYTDESETQPLITIKARKVIAINMAMDVFDSNTNEHLGIIKSRGLKSVVRDTWDILDQSENPVGLLQEDGAALLRRLLPILPSEHHIELNGQEVGKIKQIFRFFIKEFELDLSMNQGRIDVRFAVACALLALMAESGREQSN
ncbi:MAG: hypothetical protein CSA75_00710 [Sorangium cellulosum]|nr:MAG: hypothetical protein CSA75_00710 [Sorangium cellulosum]